MNRIGVYSASLVLVCCGACRQTSGATEGAEQPPNVLFIMADDLGYADLGCYGSTYALTPHLDTLASQGLRLTQFYAASAVCTPTRAAMLTGRYPLRLGITKHFGNPDHYLRHDVATLPKMLADAGYYSVHVGKWHLGGINTPEQIAQLQRGDSLRPGPLQHGFDQYLGVLRHAGLKGERQLYRQGGRHLVANDSLLPADSAWLTDIYIDRALRAMDEAAQLGRPFFINLWFDAPHTPYEPAPEPHLAPFQGSVPEPPTGHYNQANQPGDGEHYYSMIARMDEGVGRLMRKLDRLGLAENTLVVFTSDNGPSYRGETGPYRGGKADLHEGGIRVPCIVRMPGTVPAGQSNLLANTVDIAPTVCSFTGAIPPDGLDGISLWSAWTSGEAPARREMFWQLRTYRWYPQPGEKPEPFTELAYRQGPWKLLADTLGPRLLYRLDRDPAETTNALHENSTKANELFQKALILWNDPRKPLLREPVPRSAVSL